MQERRLTSVCLRTTLGSPALGDETLNLVRLHPHDPRTHFLRGELLVANHDAPGAEGRPLWRFAGYALRLARPFFAVGFRL